MDIHTYTHINTQKQIHTYANIHTRTYMHTHIYIYTSTYTHMYKHTHRNVVKYEIEVVAGDAGLFLFFKPKFLELYGTDLTT